MNTSFPVVLDLETKHSFREVANDYTKLGISMVGLFNYATDSFEAYFENDLPNLFPVLESASMIIGYNNRKFDMAVLAPYYVSDITRLPVLDLMEGVYEYLGYRVPLDELAKETLGMQKTGHGLKAIEYYRNGELDKLKEYCLSDVQITRDLYEFGRKHGVVFVKDTRGNKEIPVKWNEPAIAPDIPLTLPL